MDVALDKLDWMTVRSFLAVAETGSLSAAARKLRQSQPTVGRQIKALEASLGSELFTRNPRGLDLSDAGKALLEPAQDMAAAAARLCNISAGRDEAAKGTVRITASVVISNFVMPDIIASIRQQEPGIEVELVPSDASENLIFREADIAVRMYRPNQLEVVTKHVSDQDMALYAAKSIIDRYGQPDDLSNLAEFPFVGFDKSDLILREMRELGLEVNRSFFGVRCDDQATFWRLVCSGCGVGAMQTFIGDKEPLVERLAFQPTLPSLPMWLAAPEALRTNRRIRRVWDMLTEMLRSGH
ncbi:MAG: LysR family transcriptional regulator [Pseudomonadota bacterium]